MNMYPWAFDHVCHEEHLRWTQESAEWLERDTIEYWGS
jgi:hypothetical protein